MPDKKRMFSRRSKLLILLIVLTTALSIWHLAHKTFSSEVAEQTDLIIATRSAKSFEALTKHAAELDQLSENIENHSFADIRSSINQTIALVQSANLELMAQHEAWSNLKKRINIDANQFSALKAQLDGVQKLQDREIVRLQHLLDEANEPSFWEETFTYIVTFLLGILSSIAAAFAKEFWWDAIKQKVKSLL